MQIINRRYHKDAVNQMILKAAPSFGDESAEGRLSFSIGLKSHAGQGELEEAISGTSPKRSLPVLLLESADDSSGYGDEEMADYESPFYFQSKKRRLSAEQVRLLEMSFEEENKLEPERKLQLAKEVGLLPRQVAIWFQNRRARWKTKQLERDYDVLKAAYDSLLSDKAKLQDEIALLHVKLESSPQETSPEENSHVMNREDHPDYLSSIQPTPNLEDLPLKTAGSSLFLSDFFMLKKPSSTSEGQQLHNPISSNDAFFDSSSYASFLIDTSQQRILDLKVGSSCAVDLVGFDQKPTSAMPQSARLHGGAGDPAHYLLLKQGVLGSVVSPQYSRQHMIEFKQEADGFEAEDCCTTTFSFPLEESGGWPWFWEG